MDPDYNPVEEYWRRAARHDEIPEPFFTVSQPCEGCGRPSDERVYDADRGLWLGWDCGCAPEAPQEPVCVNLLGPITQARSVQEIVAVCKAHRETCEYCNPKVVRMQPWTAPQPRKKAA